MTRSCGDCTFCCEGWVAGQAYEHSFYPGQPCYFLKDKCSIYDSRPTNCQKFNCLWIMDTSIPDHFKPNISNMLIKINRIDNIEFVELSNNDKPLNYEVVNFFIKMLLDHQIKNLAYYIDGNICLRGSDEFVQALSRKSSIIKIWPSS